MRSLVLRSSYSEMPILRPAPRSQLDMRLDFGVSCFTFSAFDRLVFIIRYRFRWSSLSLNLSIHCRSRSSLVSFLLWVAGALGNQHYIPDVCV